MTLSNKDRNEIDDIINGKQKTFEKQVKSVKNVSIKTAVFSAILAVLIFGILLYDIHDDAKLSVWVIAFVGISTFFGMLMISSYHSEHHPHHISGSKGVMRRAMASSFVCVYFVILSSIMFGEQSLMENVEREKILEHFSNIIIVIIGFYFGSKGAIELYKEWSGRKTSEISDKHDEADEIQSEKICVIAPSHKKETGKNGLTYSHEGALHREPEIKWNKSEVTYALIKGTRDIREDSDVTEKTAMSLAMLTWGLEIDLKLKLVKKDQNPDITVNFKHSDADEYLARRKREGTNILGYAYDPAHVQKGTLVINDDYLWSATGESVEAWKVHPEHYGPEDPQTVPTYNLTSTLIHELGHTLGMPHIDDCEECIMYTHDNENVILKDQEIEIIRKKYGKTTRSEREYTRLKEWLSKRIKRKPRVV